MSDSSEPRATLPFPGETAGAPAPAAPADPLLGRWAEGLRAPVRNLPFPRPRLLTAPAEAAPAPRTGSDAATALEQRTEQADLRTLMPAASVEALLLAGPEVEAPDAWASAAEDQLASVPPPPRAGAATPVEAPSRPSAPPADAAAPGAAAAPDPSAAPAVDAANAAAASAPAAAATAPAAPDEVAAGSRAAPESAEEEPVLLLSDDELAEDEPGHPAIHSGVTGEQAFAITDGELAAATAQLDLAPLRVTPDLEVTGQQARLEVRPAGEPVPGGTLVPAEGITAVFAAPPAGAGASGWAAPALREAQPVPAEPAATPSARASDPAAPVALPDRTVEMPAPRPSPGAEGRTDLFAAPAAGHAPAGLTGGTDVFGAPPLAAVPSLPPPPPSPPAATPGPAPAPAAAHRAASPGAGDSGLTDIFGVPRLARPSAPPPPGAADSGSGAVGIAAALAAAADLAIPAGTPPAPAAALAPAPPPGIPDEDLESTVLTMQSLGAELLPDAPEGAAHAAELEAEPLPDDAIAGTADPGAPWNHAEVQVVTPEAIPDGQAPWEVPARPAAIAEDLPWAAAAPAAPAAANQWPEASATAASDGWSGAAAPVAVEPAAESWGAPPPAVAPAAEAWGAAPAAAAEPSAEAWGSAPPVVAAESGDAWSAPPAAAAAPAAAPSDWAVPPPSAPAAASHEWDAAPPAAAPAPPAALAPPDPAPASDWEPAPASAAAAPAAVSSAPWEAATHTGFAIADAAAPAALPAPGGDSPFAALAPGATLAGEDDLAPPEVRALHEQPIDLDDENLLVPIDEPEPPAPPAPTGSLAVAGEHRVAVHTRAGRTRRGVVRDIDLAGPGFALMPQTGSGPPETVQALEVKAIFFMLPPGEKPAVGGGGRVRVTFEDGRTIEGVRDGPDAPGGFFLVPGDAARTNTRRIFVARKAVLELREGS